MEQRDEKLFTVGELARRCDVTVRTLQYYDKEGLLSPSHYTEGGRRLYDRDDVMLLLQILFLKSFGFSLEEIRDRLLHIDSPEEINAMFSRQRDVLREQIKELKANVDLLDMTIDEVEKNGYLGTEKLVAIIGSMKLGNPYSFVFRYFGKEEMKTLFSWVDDGGKMEGMAADWQDMFAEMIGLYQKGADPKGPEGQTLAAKWWAHIQELTRSDPGMLKTLMEMGDDIDNWPEEAGDFKEAARDFLGVALEKYMKDIGVMPEGMEDHE